MGLGQILPITPPATNASWTLDFWGPALQCNDVTGTERDDIWINIWNSYNGSSASYPYLSWVPWVSWNPDVASGMNPDLPFHFLNSTPNEGPIGLSPSFLSTEEPASIFIAVLPESQYLTVQATGDLGTVTWWTGPNAANCPFHEAQNLTEPFTHECFASNSNFTVGVVFENSTLIRCDLVNSSYSVDFNYSNGVQDIQVHPNRTKNSPIVFPSNFFISLPKPEENGTEPATNCSPFRTNQYLDDPPCLFDSESMRLLSYQGIAGAFNQLAYGAVLNQGASIWENTTVMETVLAQTEELSFIRSLNLPSDTDVLYTLQTLISKKTAWAYPGLMNPDLPVVSGDLKSTLEQLFQNFTISLLAEPYFQ
jgi:hypothetical protein